MKLNTDGWPCDECGRVPPATVVLGEKCDFELSPLNYCADCLRKALALLEAAHAQE